MRINASMLALTLAATISCGDNSKKEQAQAPVKVSDQSELSKLNQISGELPKKIISRVPVVDGKPDFSKVEAIKVSQSLDINDSKALDQAFESASSEQRIDKIGVSDETMDAEGSLEQWCCCKKWKTRGYWIPYRPAVNACAPLVYSAGYNNYYNTGYQCGASNYFNYGGGSRSYQSYGGASSYQYQSYDYQQQGGNSWYQGGNGYQG